MLMQMAYRNVWRHRQRTLITIAAMGFASTIMLFYAALMEGMLADSERNAIAMNSSEIQIHAHGYRRDADLYKRIENDIEILQQLEGQGFQATPRLFGFGLAAAGNASAGVAIRGIDIIQEQQVTELHLHLIRGEWISNEEPYGVVIGRRLAHTLGVDIGDEVVFVSQAADGSMADALFEVQGVLKSVGEMIDRGGFIVPIDTLRELLVIPQGSHEIVLHHPDPQLTLPQKRDRAAAIAKGYEVIHWKELLPVIAAMLESADAQIIVFILITYIAVAIVILNTMLMGVFERIREFGVIKALGFTPTQLMVLIMLESLIQVTIAALITLVVGIPLAVWFTTHGIDLSTLTSGISFGGIAIDPIWRAKLTPTAIVVPVVLLYIIAMLAVLYPAIKAALIRPVAAIHHK